MSLQLARTFFQLRFAATIAYNKIVQILSRTLPRQQVAVELDQGTIIGLKHNTRLANTQYVSFLGVPYAKPPVGDLRFKPPVEHPGWSGKFKAFSEGNKCMQYVVMRNIIVGSEDCLYLNIFVPQGEQTESPGEKKAVMVFIHGGAFQYGSASMDEYTPEYLLDENVIVVNINYRLNVFGFLNLDVDECSGNMGLKDQLLAIKWIKANVSAFGGDADNITIFGESAGASSVHYHMLSPRSTGLFQKAIMQSGCMFNHWALNREHKEAAFQLAQNLACPSDDPVEIVRYLKTLPATDLIKCTKIENLADYKVYTFLPSAESNHITNPFLSAEILAKTEVASSVPVVIGVNNIEGYVVVIDDRIEKIDDFHKTDKIIKFFKGQYNEKDAKKISDFYFYENGNLKQGTTKLEGIINFYSDFFFIKDIHRGVENFLKQKIAPMYVYEFKFDGCINALKNIVSVKNPALRKLFKGACHGDELSYFFYAQLYGIVPKPDSPELSMCRTMSKLWTNFARTGNPNSPDFTFEWKPTDDREPGHLSIDYDDTMAVDGLPFSGKTEFWRCLTE